MTGLYVKLDVEYASDDKMIEAGPLAELLYVRSLAFCKKNSSTDGKFSRAQLAVIGVGIPSPKRHAATLVEVGAWNVTETGWEITAWLKRNRSNADIQAQQEMASAQGIQGNHDRWHTGPDGKPSPKCPICIALHRQTRSPTPSGIPIEKHRVSDLKVSPKEEEEEETKEETKEKPETEPKEETKTKSSKPVDGSKNGHPNAAAAALRILLDHRLKTANTPGLKPMLEKTLPDEWREPIAAFVASHPDTTAEEIATVVLKVPGLTYATSTPRAPWYADPNCIQCPGDGWVNDEHGYVSPCQCRQPDPYETLAPVHHLTRGAS